MWLLLRLILAILNEAIEPFKSIQFFGGKRLPIYHSMGVAECGLTCLAMIATYHGHKTDLATLRGRYPLSINGTNLDTLSKIAKDLQLEPHMYSLELEGLQVLKAPCILHWDMKHFVVLKKITKRYAIIHDPSEGSKRLSLAAVARSFTGVALELTPKMNFKPIKEQKSVLRLRDFWQHAKGLKTYLIQLLLLSGILQAFALIAPLFIQNVVDKAIHRSDSSLLVALASGFCLLIVFKAAATIFRSFVSMCMGIVFSFQLNNNLLSHLLRLPLSFFQSRHIGDINSRFGSLENIKSFLSGNLISVFLDGIMVITALVLMLNYSFMLTAIVFAVALTDFFIRMAFFQKIKDITAEQINARAATSSNFMETIRAITGVKIFGREQHRQQIWQSLSAEQYNLDIRLGKLTISLSAIREVLSGLENILVIALAAYMVIHHQFTLGMLFAFIAYKGQFISGVQGLFDKFNEFRMLRLHLERLSEIALAEPELDGQSIITIPADKVKGRLEFKNICFRYGTGEPLVLNNINLVINAGESVALTGLSGCGKTTLMKIAIGLLEPNSGEILLDGVNIKKIGAKQYRTFIGAVMQDDTLLSGSLADNICFFDPEPEQERIEECARLASVYHDINEMPMRYNTLIGDMGSSLSGGQKQRVLLARALYAKPKILFLDEATSHLDTENEKLASEAISKLNITRLIIAHRQETVATADTVFTLEHKKTHNE